MTEQTELEQRLAEALSHGAQGAPGAIGLAAAARSRARAKRRTRLAGVAAVVALGVGVPAAVLANQGSGGDGGPGPGGGPTAKDTESTGAPGLPSGYHYESWHDVSVEVPNTWVYGALDQWCADDGLPDEPRVQRPGGVQTEVLCSPVSGYGVIIAPSEGQDVDWPLAAQHSDAWPDGAYVGATTVGDVVVTVVARKSTVASYVLDSVEQNVGVDPHGCPLEAGSDPVVPGDSMTVCRYDESGGLEQSELLTGTDLDDAEAALSAAPAADPADCAGDPGQTLRLASVAEDATIDLGCGSLLVHGQARQLTEDVLYWALSPGWSGSVPHGVSLPSELRKP